MMDSLIALGTKSLVIAALTLALLRLTRRRSAADRSWIAHLGPLSLVALPLASLALPSLPVELPAAFAVEAAPAPVVATITPAAPAAASLDDLAPSRVETAPIDWVPIAYAIPALALLIVTMLALLRLFALRRRAEVLVDPTWLGALAHAQRRWGSKAGFRCLPVRS